MRISHDDNGYDRIATIDIETTHYDASQGETVSVGIGIHDRGDPLSEASYELYHRSGDDEYTLISYALRDLDNLDVDGLISYQGREFDFEFLADRCKHLGEPPVESALNTPASHIDLFEGRKERCDSTGEKWPSLEECLESYELPTPTTVWGGAEISNTRFGKEVGPAYLDALNEGNNDRAESIKRAINHYLTTDLEANIALYYADIGESITPSLIATEREF
ncbi:ribonuclease H-like domain-containing protein [Halovivax limisalsi]|uniref:ribonuclease H-like domain-containing protein n=1 Tax=Halovivax limisalsi TaxID=1453760 RepID=UPI001FFC94C1|nr:ribonuclease H-like domain-containing protein [Halovivax limisalsi]